MTRRHTLSDTATWMGGALAITLAAVALLTFTGEMMSLRDRWHAPDVHAQTGDPAEFPANVDGYRLVQAWYPPPTRVYIGGQWAPAYGPDAATLYRFPSTLMDCERTAFLYRWRVIGGARVRASLIYSWHDAPITLTAAPADPDSDVTASRGWAVTDGCRTPVFAAVDGQGRTVFDVAVEVQEWTAAP